MDTVPVIPRGEIYYTLQIVRSSWPLSNDSSQMRSVDEMLENLREIEIVLVEQRLQTQSHVRLVNEATGEVVKIVRSDVERFRQRQIDDLCSSNSGSLYSHLSSAGLASADPPLEGGKRSCTIENETTENPIPIDVDSLNADVDSLNTAISNPEATNPTPTDSKSSLCGRLSWLCIALVAIGLVSGVMVLLGNQVTPRLADDCILLIGGRHSKEDNIPPIEFYHPDTNVECNVTRMKLSTELFTNIARTSGCVLSDRKQLLLRESVLTAKTPSRLYGIESGILQDVPLPFTFDGLDVYIQGSTTSANADLCLSCGGCVPTSNRPCAPTDDRKAACYAYNTSQSQWQSIEPVPAAVSGAVSVMLGESDFYMIGGWNDYGTKELYRYDIRKDNWSKEAPMKDNRDGHSAAPLSRDEMIVCGGSYERRDCEIYNATKRRWRRASPMSELRFDFSLVNLGGRVYALGGAQMNTHRRLTDVEVYDHAADMWTPVAKPLRHARDVFVGLVVSAQDTVRS